MSSGHGKRVTLSCTLRSAVCGFLGCPGVIGADSGGAGDEAIRCAELGLVLPNEADGVPDEDQVPDHESVRQAVRALETAAAVTPPVVAGRGTVRLLMTESRGRNGGANVEQEEEDRPENDVEGGEVPGLAPDDLSDDEQILENAHDHHGDHGRRIVVVNDLVSLDR